MRTHIIGATSTQVETNRVPKVLLQVNAALTGVITVIDGLTDTDEVVAIITNPTVGGKYEYWNFKAGVRVITSAVCDITVNTHSGAGAVL